MSILDPKQDAAAIAPIVNQAEQALLGFLGQQFAVLTQQISSLPDRIVEAANGLHVEVHVSVDVSRKAAR